MSAAPFIVVMSGGGAVPVAPSVAPSVVIDDTFTDTDNVLLVNHTIAPTNAVAAVWGAPVLSENGMKIASNAAIIGTNPGSSFLETGLSDVTITASVFVSATSADHLIYVYARVKNATNFISCFFGTGSGSRIMRIYEYTAGVGIVKQSSTPLPTTGFAPASYTMTIVLSGTQITFTVGTNVLTHTTSYLLTETKHGLGIYGNASDYVTEFKITNP